jgi:Uma2 family endonuclease
MDHARLTLVSAADYLAMDQGGDARHEFVAGQVFAMVGARDSHNTVALNIASRLRESLRSGPCKVFMSDVKLRVDLADAYYYPDIFVTCDPRDSDPYVKQFPALVIEVLSPRTEGVDRREKLRNYRLLETLKEYGIVSVEERKVEIYRLEPGAEWHHYAYSDAEVAELQSVDVKLPLVDVYEGVSASASQ